MYPQTWRLLQIDRRAYRCIIVDSTRKGKRVPDALSKTIPIWCATINNAVRKRALQNQARQHELRLQEQGFSREQGDVVDTATTAPENHNHLVQSSVDRNGTISLSPGNVSETDCKEEPEPSAMLLTPCLDGERWDTRYHSLPSLISRSEHAQIAEKINGFAEKLMRFTDMTPLTTRLLKPIRPIWITPQSLLLKDNLPDYSQVGFLPVICLSASRVVQDGMEERDGYLYVQGSGDDEEMWAKGLRPDLFWENEEYLLEEGISPTECEKRAREVVLEAKKKQLKSQSHHVDAIKEHTQGGRIIFTPSMELCSEIKPGPIWIGNNASGRIPECWASGFDMVINCGAEIARDPRFEQQADKVDHITLLGGMGHGGAQATLCTLQKHQWKGLDNTSLEAELLCRKEGEQDFYYLHLPIAEGKKGQHQLLAMIPMAIKAVQQMYEARIKADESQEDKDRPKILVHCQQGMDRSVGIALALLVSCFDENTGEFNGIVAGQQTASKELIQKRLFQIMSHRLAARPSRATLKMVNTHFMSPTDPPPAKYKQ
ncbi:hypothetical protein BGZ51_002718 [Haplosporangium sp. Z 767]|nr:hypothetical protein BGZ50_003202 [Haplosporangium sp. Z 11]KAF9185330.1 hypothetical protein BGZ51_002718 [Haplosporangium sp. Z 767]